MTPTVIGTTYGVSRGNALTRPSVPAAVWTATVTV